MGRKENNNNINKMTISPLLFSWLKGCPFFLLSNGTIKNHNMLLLCQKVIMSGLKLTNNIHFDII